MSIITTYLQVSLIVCNNIQSATTSKSNHDEPVPAMGWYHPYSLPKDSEIPKLRYVEIDNFNNSSCTTPSAIDKASFTTRFGEKSKAITSVRKLGMLVPGYLWQVLPIWELLASPCRTDSDSVTSVRDSGPSSGFKRLHSSTSAGGGACLQL